jgi:alkylation response protein AidB-like acyl-CoA dehydrogenase
MTGESHFSEVFLTDVEIPTDQVLGGLDRLNQGWPAAVHTLANERAMIGGGTHMADLGAMIELARTRGLTDDPRVRQDLAAAHTRTEILGYLGYRAQTAMAHGRAPGPETSIMKLFMADHLRRTGSLGKAILGADGMLAGSREDGSNLLTWRFLQATAISIAGGTNEVQRSIIGERVLGLPRDPKPSGSGNPERVGSGS